MENTGDLPVSDRPAGEVHYAQRLGVCQKCSTQKRPVPKVMIDNMLSCPNCDTKSQTKSGLVNRIQDPGEEAFTRVTHKDKNGKEYIELVPKNASAIQALAKKQNLKVGSAKEEVLPTAEGSMVQGPPIHHEINVSAQTLMLKLKEIVEGTNVKTIPQFKSRDKIVKTLKKLQSQVDDLIGGHNE